MQDAEPLPSRRARRGLIAFLILLLILLPLYLWPLRGGVGGPLGASALSGSARDPRNAAALAQIPGDVWDALMGHTAPAPSLPPKPPRNLTMITEAEGIPGASLDEGGDAPLLARDVLARLGVSDLSGDPGAGDAPSAPVEFLASSPGGATGTGDASSGFIPSGYPGSGNFGPLGGGGSGGAPDVSPGPTLDPGGPGDLAPTPEPATLVLVGSNLTLLGVVAWRRRRRRLGIETMD